MNKIRNFTNMFENVQIRWKCRKNCKNLRKIRGISGIVAIIHSCRLNNSIQSLVIVDMEQSPLPVGRCTLMTSESLDGWFSDVSAQIFTMKYVLKSSRWDLQDAHYSTDLRARFFSTKNREFSFFVFQNFCKIRLKIQFLQGKIENFKRKMHINENLQNLNWNSVWL